MPADNWLLQCALTLSAFLFVLPTGSRAQPSAAPQAPQGFTERAFQEADRFNLLPNARQAADIIGVEPLLKRLSFNAVPAMSLEELSLYQQITGAIVVASLDLDSVVDYIDNERAQIVELQNIVLARRQRAIGTTNLATLALSTGLGALSGVLQFSDTTKGAGNIIGFAAGGLSTLLSFHSLRQQHSGKRPGRVLPGMLAPFFHDPHAEYPADIWAYLNSVPAGDRLRQAEGSNCWPNGWQPGVSRLWILLKPHPRSRCLPTLMRQTRNSTWTCQPNEPPC
jgi:hypothetical protein